MADWRDTLIGVSRQFYSPVASDIAHNCIVYAVIFGSRRVVFARSPCERCELYGRIEYH